MLVGPAEIRDRPVEGAEELFGEIRERTEDHASEVRTVTEFGKPSRVIPECTEAHGIDLIVIGSHGRSLVSRVLLGDVAGTVVQRAPVPVTVVRGVGGLKRPSDGRSVWPYPDSRGVHRRVHGSIL
ncbi:universal stress protein [Salinirubellus sp. GCM10025818]|uniref:universal stress protein n=1 Tax=Salinirubellus TaxID=2162630 RepID=UPI0030CD1446